MDFEIPTLIEKNCFYHGSISADIKELTPLSFLQGTDKKVVYLTDNIPYALFYIWNGNHNNYDRKFVTGYMKNKTACYEEVFPNQLEAFYKGVSGYLYCIEKGSDISAVDGREAMYYSENAVSISARIYISDVYRELMKYEAAGEFKLFGFNEQSEEKQNELTDKYADIIIKSDFFKGDEAKLKFYKKYFLAAWEHAESIHNK